MVLKEFRRSLNSLCHADVLPDYEIDYDRQTDMVTFVSRDEAVHMEENQRNIVKLFKQLMLQK